MKFYKRKPIDRHNPIDSGWAVEANGDVVTNSSSAMELPSGVTNERPATVVDGQLRYSETLNEAEGQINGVWERIRTVRPATITAQNLGYGNYLNDLFGPLNPDYDPSYVAGPNNVMVYVDNVYQIPTINYTFATTPADSIQSIAGDVLMGATVIPLTTLTNVLIGQTISGPAAIQANTVISSIISTSSSIVISLPTVDNMSNGTLLDFTYSTGTYITFSGAVPYKPVVAMLGFDGYFPPN